MSPSPSSILIIGSGVFGLSTAYALATRPEYEETKITVLDRSSFPASDAASVDSSRLVRSDYADLAYAQLAAEAMKHWRGEYGAEGRYTESGFAVLLNDDGGDEARTMKRAVLEHIQKLGLKIGKREDGAEIVLLNSRQDVMAATPGFTGAGGDNGFVNYSSGWAQAEDGLAYMRKQVEALGRVEFRIAEVESLIFDRSKPKHRVSGAVTKDGERLLSDLTVLAAGAWSSTLVDLRGRATATGQVMAYVKLTDGEQTRLEKNPSILNPSNFMFIIQPRGNVLKVARHGYGYANPQEILHPEHRESGEKITVSVPLTKHDDPNLQIPLEGSEACRQYMAQCLPDFAQRPWLQTRICWYLDTPSEDWVIDYHPLYRGLFVATGGSGHGYKFLPVIGERIVDVMLDKPRDELGTTLQHKWKWSPQVATEDLWTHEWRGGRRGMMLDAELARQVS